MGQRLLRLLIALALPSAALAQVRLGSEFQVNTNTIVNQRIVAVATDADGDFVVVWHSYHDGANTGVFGQRFSSAGAPSGVEFRINTYTPGFQFAPSVAVETNGDFVVAWVSRNQDTDSDDIFASRFSSAGTLLGAELRVNSYTLNKQGYPRVTSDADGDFVVAWEAGAAQDGAGYGVFGQRFSSEGVALAAEFQVNAFTTSDQRAVSAAGEGDGDFVVTWHSRMQDGNGYGIFARRFSSSGTAQAAEFQVSTYTENYQSEPSVAIHASGAFVIAWDSYLQDGNQNGTFAQRFGSDGTPLAAEFQVNTYTADAQKQATVAATTDGFVVAWRSQLQDASSGGVFSRLFSSAGAPLAAEFRVNTYTTDDQYRPAAAGGVDGDFVVVWQSVSQDGSAVGVFAQRFGANIVLDVDGNGAVDSLTDGLLILRHLFGFTGTTLTSGVVAVNCTRCDAAAIEPYLDGLGLVLDIDDNGAADALTDGLLALRYMFGFTGTTLTNGVVDDECERCDASTIVPYLEGLS